MEYYIQRTVPKTESKNEMRLTLQRAAFGPILDQARFVLFKHERGTKVPKQITGANASSTNMNTWTTFDEAYEAFISNPKLFDGLGIVLGSYYGTKLVGVDMDHVKDAFTGEWINKEAEKAASQLMTYGELSVSGTGMHYLFLNQDVDEIYRTKSSPTSAFPLEVYQEGRYFTLSGLWDERCTLSQDKEGLEVLCQNHLSRKTIQDRQDKQPRKPIQVMELAEALKIDGRFRALYQGARPEQNESSDDLALANRLVKYIGRDEKLIEKAFLESPHFESKDSNHKAKCTGREDYLKVTIRKAIKNYFKGYSYDDVGNSEMFVDMYSDKLVYCKEWMSWACWDGKVWQRNSNLFAQEYAKEMSENFRARYHEYKTKQQIQDTDLMRSMGKHAQNIRSSKSIASMTKLASSRAVIGAEKFDADAFMFNVGNGTYNLRTGELLEHDSQRYCTMIAGCDYDPSAQSEKWKGFLRKVLPPEGIEYLQMAVGMAAVGKVYEEAMIFMIGAGANGKSTIANILSGVFGTYSLTLQPDVITATRDGKTPPDFAMVRGSRIVFLSETEEGDRLSTKALKRLSSSERIAARRLYSMPEVFMPTHTIFYSTNHPPKITSTDNGIWRRIKKLSFEYSFSEAEKITSFADDVLRDEACGVLNWVFEGARKFIDLGCKLPTPEFVLKATLEYKAEEDTITQFVQEWCDVGDMQQRVGAAEMYHGYKEFCAYEGIRAKAAGDFSRAFDGIEGVKKVNVSGKKWWVGVRLRDKQKSDGKMMLGKWVG